MARSEGQRSFVGCKSPEAFDATPMRKYPVGTRVNRTHNNDADCAREVPVELLRVCSEDVKCLYLFGEKGNEFGPPFSTSVFTDISFLRRNGVDMPEATV